MTPPQSPNILDKITSMSSIPNNIQPSLERIVTVPPVNENSVANADAKRSGNVWLKINSEANSNKTDLRRQQEIHNLMHPLAYPAYNMPNVAYPSSFNGPPTYPGVYMHDQDINNQSLLQVMPYHPQQHYLQPA